jgi:uncharacterized protein (TIGR02996 family)
MTNSPANDVWSASRILLLAPDQKSIAAAREVLKKGGFGTVERTADGSGWCALCKGTTGEYRVWVLRGEGGKDDDDFLCQCTCPSQKYPCKHGLALLLYLLDHPELRVEREEPTRTTGDVELLLRAAFREPKDDTPRLILADCLEELGQADRARLIRVQCEAARLPARSGRRKTLRAEEKGLLRAVRPLFDPMPSGITEVEMVRGFLRFELDAYWFGGVAGVPTRVADLFRDGWIEFVRVRSHWDLPSEILALLCLAGELDLTQATLDESGLLALAAAAHGDGRRVAGVKVHRRRRALYEAFVAARGGPAAAPLVPRRPNQTTASYQELTAEQIGILLRSGRLDGLRVLGIDGPIGDDGARALATHDGLGGLEDLTLSDSRIGPTGAAALAGAAWATGLRRLRLVGRALDDEAFAGLCRAADFPGLTELEVDGGLIGDDAAGALARAGRFPRLARTRWDATLLTPRGAATLLGPANLPALAECGFVGNPLEPERWLPIALGAADRPRLRIMFRDADVVRTLSPDGLALQVTSARSMRDVLAGVFPADAWHAYRGPSAPTMTGRRLEELLGGLAGCRAAKRVTAVTFTGFRIDAVAVRALSAGLARDRLAALELPDNALGNDGAAALADAFARYRPVSLNLSDNNIRRTGAEALAASAVLSRVETLDLSQNNIGLPGVLAVVESPHAAALRQLVIKGTWLSNTDMKELRERSRAAVVV